MSELREKVELRIRELREIISEKEKSMKGAPAGIINIHVSGEQPRYYYKRHPKDKVRKYIREKDKELAKKLCQKDYDEKVVKLAKKEMAILNKLYQLYQKPTCEDVYLRLNKHRQSLITPIYFSDEEYIKNWEAVEYEPMKFRDDSLVYYTDKGEKVRSKSEVIIANALNKNNIPYYYEQPLHLKGNITIHPDFTILNVRKRKTIYYEHFGMMDDLQYVENVLKKLETYEENGIFPGDQLIFTFESGKKPINQNILNLIMSKYFIL